jgi:hypothetical protein
MILVLSDNGNAKGSIMEQGVRTLMTFRYPAGGVVNGTIVTTPVNNIDVAASIFELIGAEITVYDTDGVSWAPLVTGGNVTMITAREAFVVEIANDVGVIDTAHPAMTKLVYQDQVPASHSDWAFANYMPSPVLPCASLPPYYHRCSGR